MDKDKVEVKKSALTDEELNDIYGWVDQFSLTRPKKNIARDFSDGLLVAEMVKGYYPKLVELHNFPSSHNVKQKTTNWGTLNRKVFNRMNFQVLKTDIDDIVNCKQYAVEKFLIILQVKIDKYKEMYKDDTTVNLEQLTGYDKTTNDGTNMGGISESNIRQSYNNSQQMNENYPLTPQNNMQLMYQNDPMSMGGGQNYAQNDPMSMAGGQNYGQNSNNMAMNTNQNIINTAQKSKRTNKTDFGPNSVNSSNYQRHQRQSPVIQRAGMNNLRGVPHNDPLVDISTDNRGHNIPQNNYNQMPAQYMSGNSKGNQNYKGGGGNNQYHGASDLGFTQTTSNKSQNNYKGKSSKDMEGL